MSYKKLESPLIRGLCISCGVNPQHHKGNGKYRALCYGCHCKRYNITSGTFTEEVKSRLGYYSYSVHKLDHCELCGFIPINECQLDIDHIDGNHKNNSRDNLQTLCANCHRLKTFLNKDGIYKTNGGA